METKKCCSCSRKTKNSNREMAKKPSRSGSQTRAAMVQGQFFMEEIYDLARLRTRVMGFQWHVDHIVSIKSPLVCGLHVENNLRVIPAIENLKKRNRWWPDMPEVI